MAPRRVLNKILHMVLDDNLTFKLYSRSIQSDIKINNTLLKLVNENYCSVIYESRV